MKPIHDLNGKKFGHLTVTGMAGRSADGRVMWHCLCDCGKSLDVRSYSLVAGATVSCGCSRIKDLTNRRFGKLVVLSLTDEVKNTFRVWECRCDCGNVVAVASGDLVSGNTKSCGCAVRDPRPSIQKDLTGQRFGKLTAIRPTEHRKNGYVMWECKCDCGNIVEVRSSFLSGGKKKSCGCMKLGRVRDSGFDKEMKL